MGCIRLTVADAKWIFDNCPLGTSVEFYSSSNPGPLGKPSAKKISSYGKPLMNWDPTDPDPNNPWRNQEKLEAEKKAAEEEAKRKAEEEEAKKKAAEEETRKQAEEAAKKQAEEEARKKAEEEAKNKIKVPNVVGQTESNAKKSLSDFNIEVKYEETNSGKNGTVTKQSLTAGSLVDKKTKITITVLKVKQANNTAGKNETETQENTTNKSSNQTVANNTVNNNTTKSN